MRSSSKRILSIIGSALLFIGSLVVYANFIRPAFDEVKDLRGQLAARSKVLDERGAAISEVHKLLQQFSSIANVQETISTALPLEPNVAWAIAQYNAIAQKSGSGFDSLGVKEQNINVPPPTGRGPAIKGTGQLRFNLKFFGSYESIKALLEGIETNIRVSDVKNISITPGGEKNENVFAVALQLDTYYQTR